MRIGQWFPSINQSHIRILFRMLIYNQKNIEPTSKISRHNQYAFSPMMPFCIFSQTSVETNKSMTVPINHSFHMDNTCPPKNEQICPNNSKTSTITVTNTKEKGPDIWREGVGTNKINRNTHKQINTHYNQKLNQGDKMLTFYNR